MPQNNSRRHRRKWEAEKKIEILQSHFNKSRIVDTCDEYRIHPVMFSKWWKTVVESGLEALRGGDRKEKKSVDRRIALLEKEIERKNAVIAELSEDVLKLKKFNGEN